MKYQLVVCLVLLTGWPCYGQLLVDNYDPNIHDRFDGDREGQQFVGEGLDFSGVSRDIRNVGRWVTMVSPLHFLTSNHAVASQTVIFHLDNDRDGPTIECAIDHGSGRRIGTSDVLIGMVVPTEECDTSLVRQYSIASPGNYQGDTVVAVGGSRWMGSTNNNLSMRVGHNVMDYASSADEFRGAGDLAVYVDDTFSGDVANEDLMEGPIRIDHEFRFQNGDSGGPSFVVNEHGELVLFGIHSYLGYDGMQGDDVVDSSSGQNEDPENGDLDSASPPFIASRWASFDTYLPTIRNDILEEVIKDLPDFEAEFDVDVQPVGSNPGDEFFVIESTLDCNLDNVVDEQDLDCATWAGSLVPFDLLLEVLNLVEGDIDLDGKVGFTDFLTLSRNYDLEDVYYTGGDIDLDGIVGFSDYLAISANFGMTSPPTEDSMVASIPEPSGNRLLQIAAVLTLASIRPRKRQR